MTSLCNRSLPITSTSLGRWIPWWVASGQQQMQIDRWLLTDAIEQGSPQPILRFYGWQRATLSWGCHQQRVEVDGDPLVGCIDQVRRPTGGRAVFHQSYRDEAELTYCLVMPYRGTANRRQAYRELCQFLRLGLASWGIVLDEGSGIPDHAVHYSQKTSCFASQTAADLSWRGQKVIGSAQLWQRGYVLQHGSMILQPNRPLWEKVLPGSSQQVIGLAEIVGQPIDRAALMESLLKAASQYFGCGWQAQPLTPQEYEASGRDPLWVSP
ncbi:MAG: lipoate--protein ligase family protein [Cyanobacteriota bacterium]|nr:lipoate--protein ligase family protein [Cyanobacteriota bacterium]